MATSYSAQMTEGFRKYPIDDHGKLRFQRGNVAALAVALASADQIEMFRLPPGRIRILPWLCRISTSAWGSSRTLSLGHRAYPTRPPGETLEAEAGTAFLNALDVSSAVAAAAFGTTMKYDIYSRTEVSVFATIGGGTMPVAATLDIMMAYLYE